MTLHHGDVVKIDASVPQIGDLFMVVLRNVPAKQEVRGLIPGQAGVVSCSYGDVKPAMMHLDNVCQMCFETKDSCKDCTKM